MVLTYSYSGASSRSDAGRTGKERGADELSNSVVSVAEEAKMGANAAASKSVVEKQGPSGGHEAERSGSDEDAG